MKRNAKRIAAFFTALSSLSSAQALNSIAAENNGYQDDMVRQIYSVNNIASTSRSVLDGSSFKEEKNDTLIRDQIGKAYDFYKKLGWTSYDGQGAIIYFVNASSDRPLNAATQRNTTITFNGHIQVGEETYNSVNHTTALDVLAHEYTHLVTESKLEWNGCEKGETYCLLEAYSDIMGELCENKGDWKIGADLFEEEGYSLRDIADPYATMRPLSGGEMYENDFFVDYEDLRTYLKNNNGFRTAAGAFSDATRGSTVISHAAYLMNMNGISRKDLRKLWYRSMDTMKDITKETRYATFSDCRKAVTAAVDIFKGNKKQKYLDIINNAFDQVNVYIEGDINGDGITDTRDIGLLNEFIDYKNANWISDQDSIGIYRDHFSTADARPADINRDDVINEDDLNALKEEVVTSKTQSELGSQYEMDSFIIREQNERFPDGNLWKTIATNPSDSAQSMSYTPYTTVDNYVTVNTILNKGYDASFDTAAEEPYYQCAGFAKRLQFDYFGTTKCLQLRNAYEYQPRIGDHLRIYFNVDDYRKGNPTNEHKSHSIFITGVNGPEFTYADCNAGGNDCAISWGKTGHIETNYAGQISAIRLEDDDKEYKFEWVERPLMVGDVNGDSYVNYDDVTMLYEMIGTGAGSESISERYRYIAADIDQNGKLDWDDASLLIEEAYSCGNAGRGYIK